MIFTTNYLIQGEHLIQCHEYRCYCGGSGKPKVGLSFPRAMEITFKNCGGRNVAKKNGTA